jgi:hypothetical protein
MTTHDAPTRISDVAPDTLATLWPLQSTPVLLASLYLRTVGSIPTAPRLPCELGGAS